MSYNIIKEVVIDANRATGKTKHYRGSEELSSASKLQIAQYVDDEGFYLFYLDDKGEVMSDTYHATVEGAMEQAEWEYSVNPHEWSNVSE